MTFAAVRGAAMMARRPFQESTMPIIIEDRQTATLLRAANGPEEVRSADGGLLGRFIPAPRPGMTFPELGLTDEELERRLNDPNAKWHTADEVMARLAELRRRD